MISARRCPTVLASSLASCRRDGWPLRDGGDDGGPGGAGERGGLRCGAAGVLPALVASPTPQAGGGAWRGGCDVGGGARKSGARSVTGPPPAGEGCCTHPTTAAAGGFFVVGTFTVTQPAPEPDTDADTGAFPRRKERRHRRRCGSPTVRRTRRMPTAWAIRRRQPIMRRPVVSVSRRRRLRHR